MRKGKYQNLGIMDFLERLAFGGVPKFNRDCLYKEIKKTQPLERPAYSKEIYSLKRHGFIDYLNNQEFILTKKGLRRIDFLRFEKLALLNRKRDNLWRLIIFDIPEQQRAARKLFRNKLLEFECYQLQKSVYITPYVCEKELAKVVKVLGISQYVYIILTKSLGSREGELEKFFR